MPAPRVVPGRTQTVPPARGLWVFGVPVCVVGVAYAPTFPSRFAYRGPSVRAWLVAFLPRRSVALHRIKAGRSPLQLEPGTFPRCTRSPEIRFSQALEGDGRRVSSEGGSTVQSRQRDNSEVGIVFWVSAAFALAFILWGVIAPENFGAVT